MWSLLACLSALADDAVLHVAVHQEAGSIYEVAADGAAGQCRVLGLSRIACPADGPVVFRWGGADGWALHGDRSVVPGAEGVAFVLPPDGSRDAERERLREPTLQAVQDVFLRTGANPVRPPSPDLFGDLVALGAHDDWRIRALVVDALVPWVRHTASDPFPPDAPSLLPEGLVLQLAADPAPQVRRRVARLIREMRGGDPRAEEARRATEAFRDDRDKRVRKLATVLQTTQATEGMTDPLEAWLAALSRVPEPGPVGRAACKALATLHDHVPPGSVDPDRAVALVIAHHPEKAWAVWGAWKAEVPFHPARARYLLGSTLNLSMGLLRQWATDDPVGLAAVLSDWEPTLPHSDRFGVIARWLEGRVEDPVLLHVLTWDGTADTLSGLPEPTPEQ
ncbi:MAG: hypothetical protein H6736_09950 [Alphaproteobacteria bacterium]|nr:hypothetical protein [Alphaproteobacteria bacterium]MCB9692123.1 hypothetical protein [Alphaproteobacteria bacterium]